MCRNSWSPHSCFLPSLSSPIAFSQSPSRHGIDLTDLDRKADPCNDFYEFANGTWRANHPIPASMTRWSKRWAGESSKDKLKEILEGALHNTRIRAHSSSTRASVVEGTAGFW